MPLGTVRERLAERILHPDSFWAERLATTGPDEVDEIRREAQCAALSLYDFLAVENGALIDVDHLTFLAIVARLALGQEIDARLELELEQPRPEIPCFETREERAARRTALDERWARIRRLALAAHRAGGEIAVPALFLGI